MAELPTESYCHVNELLSRTDAPKASVAKVFQELAKRGVLMSTRGSNGGFRLSPKALQMSLMDVVEAVDGPWQSAALDARALCLHERPCPLLLLLQPVASELERVLRSTRVADLAAVHLKASSGQPDFPAFRQDVPTRSLHGEES